MFGPVEVRGTLHGLVMTPVGVTMVADTSMSSMLPYMQRKSHDSHVPPGCSVPMDAYMFFFIPEARVAIHPPTVLNSMLRSSDYISVVVNVSTLKVTCQAHGRV